MRSCRPVTRRLLKAGLLARIALGHRGPWERWFWLAAVATYVYAVYRQTQLAVRARPEAVQRPIVAIFMLLGVAFTFYLVAVLMAIRAREDHWLLASFSWRGIAFRLVMLDSWPIQEIDIYRYLWDGAVTTSGISPYRYSPQQVMAQSANEGCRPTFNGLLHCATTRRPLKRSFRGFITANCQRSILR